MARAHPALQQPQPQGTYRENIIHDASGDDTHESIYGAFGVNLAIFSF